MLLPRACSKFLKQFGKQTKILRTKKNLASLKPENMAKLLSKNMDSFDSNSYQGRIHQFRTIRPFWKGHDLRILISKNQLVDEFDQTLNQFFFSFVCFQSNLSANLNKLSLFPSFLLGSLFPHFWFHLHPRDSLIWSRILISVHPKDLKTQSTSAFTAWNTDCAQYGFCEIFWNNGELSTPTNSEVSSCLIKKFTLILTFSSKIFPFGK